MNAIIYTVPQTQPIEGSSDDSDDPEPREDVADRPRRSEAKIRARNDHVTGLHFVTPAGPIGGKAIFDLLLYRQQKCGPR